MELGVTYVIIIIIIIIIIIVSSNSKHSRQPRAPCTVSHSVTDVT